MRLYRVDETVENVVVALARDTRRRLLPVPRGGAPVVDDRALHRAAARPRHALKDGLHVDLELAESRTWRL